MDLAAKTLESYFFCNSSATKTRRHKYYNIIFLIPSLIRGALKFISKSKCLSNNFKRKSICVSLISTVYGVYTFLIKV